jgi:hypothetical protein
MTTYIYIPIMTPEMATIAKTWNTGRVTHGEAPHPIIAVDDKGMSKSLRRTFGEGKLQNVLATDTVYLLSHGITARNGGAAIIGNDRGGRLVQGLGLSVVDGTAKTYTETQLSRSIKKEGLTTSFVDLRLFCCGAGLPVGLAAGRVVRPYAERLKNVMLGEGFSKIVVTGFLGNLIAGYSEFYAPGTNFLNRDTPVAGIGLGIQVPGETYAQRAESHQRTF